MTDRLERNATAEDEGNPMDLYGIYANALAHRTKDTRALLIRSPEQIPSGD